MASNDSANNPLQRSRRNLGILVLVLLLLGGLWLLWWVLVGSQRIESNDAYVTGNIAPVPAQVDGTVRRVFVQNTQYVHAGELLAALQGDRSTLAMQAKAAALGWTVRQLRQEFAQVPVVQHRIQAQQATLHKLQDNLQRYLQAQASGSVAAIQISDTQQDILSVKARIATLQARLRAARALVAKTELANNPQVQAAATAFELSYVQWLRRDIRAPISGYIAQRAVQAGQMVQGGERLFSIVPLQPLWVVANIKETEMAQVRPGDPVTLHSYYYGGSVRYHGRVEGLLPGAGSAFSILPPENATGNYIHIVERVPVRISLPAKELERHPLRPGLSMVVQIQIHGHSGRSVLQPLTRTSAKGYETTLYQQELQQARQAAQRIIVQNAGGGKT